MTGKPTMHRRQAPLASPPDPSVFHDDPEDSTGLPSLAPLRRRDSTAQTAAAVAHWRGSDIAETGQPDAVDDVDTLAPEPSQHERLRDESRYLARESATTETAVPAPYAGGRYELIERVGQGGFGEVWRARQAPLNRLVAVKRVRHSKLATAANGADAEHERLRLEMDFRHEAMTTAQLEHPNIVPVHDLGVDQDGFPLLAMKYLKGDAWDKLLKEDFAKLHPHDYLAKHLPVMVDLAQAVAFAHSRGVIHRDLKPAQVMVGEFGESVLMDWGLAVIVDAERFARAAGLDPGAAANTFATLETASNPSGTPAMMAPEQTEQTPERLGYWTDVYLLGGTLYHVLTGSYPHVARNSAQAMRKAMVGDVEPPEVRAAGREVPAELSALCMRALSPKPEERVESASAFLAALQDYASGSSRRGESALLVHHAAQRFEESRDNYSELNDCLNLVARARALWPQNPDVAPAREKLLGRMAETALRNGDLTLAQLQAESMAPSDRRDALLGRTRSNQRKLRRRERQRRLVTAAALVLLGAFALAAFAARRNYADRISASEASREQERLRRFFDAAAALREREERLAAAFERSFPLPDQLLAAVESPVASDDAPAADSAGAIADEPLLAERDELRRLRSTLAALAPDGFRFEPRPLSLLLGRANSLLRGESSPERLAEALRLYEVAEVERQGRPEPLIGQGVALARMGEWDRSAKLLARAAETIRRAGADDQELLQGVLSMFAAASRSAGRAGDADRALAEAREVAERRLARLSLETARRLSEAGE